MAIAEVFYPGNYPQELAGKAQWVSWCLEKNEDRFDKVPMNPKNGNSAASDNPETWGTLEEASDACDRYGHAGVGYVFNGEETGLDLDHVLDREGILKEEYRWIVEDADTYTEVSPSGDGLHLLFIGSKPDGLTACSKKQPDDCKVEMYDHGRFFTMTGNLFVDADGVVHDKMREAPDVLIRVHEKYLKRPKPKKSDTGNATVEDSHAMSDEEVITAMMDSTKAELIDELMNGDISRYGMDHSEADYGLLKELAYYTGGDSLQMERIFKTSKLYRPDKCEKKHHSDGRTYLQGTIDRALEDTDEYYIPAAIRKGIQPSQSITKARSCGIWYVDKGGRLLQYKGEKKPPELVTTTPPFIVANLKSISDGSMRALVSVTVNGMEHECAIDRDVLFNNRKIIDALAPAGANISTTNAAKVVAYLTAADGAFSKDIPTRESCNHLGWVSGDVGDFMPYDSQNGSSDVRFDPPNDMVARISPFKEPAGTLKDWAEKMKPQIESSTAFRAVMAAGFASVLLPVLNVQAFTVHNWHDSRSGKTACLKCASSIWGSPSPETSGAYCRTFNDTESSLTRYAVFLGNMPLCIDELQAKNVSGTQLNRQQSIQNFLYNINLGSERSRNTTSGTMQPVSGSWRLLSITTGEIPILNETTQQGASNRTLEINSRPFNDSDQALEMHVFVNDHYGHAGREYVKGLQKIGGDELRKQWGKFMPRVMEKIEGNPQVANIALLAFSDALAECLVFSKAKKFEDALRGSDGSISFAVNLASITATREQRDVGRRGIEFVSDWLTRNEGHFKRDTDEYPTIDCYGRRSGSSWFVLTTVLRKEVSDANFAADPLLKRMKTEGILVCSNGRYTTQQRIGSGNPQRVYHIDGDELSKFINTDD